MKKEFRSKPFSTNGVAVVLKLENALTTKKLSAGTSVFYSFCYLPHVSKIAYVCFFGGEDFETLGKSDLKANDDTPY